jgi:hypothetical protein
MLGIILFCVVLVSVLLSGIAYHHHMRAHPLQDYGRPIITAEVWSAAQKTAWITEIQPFLGPAPSTTGTWIWNEFVSPTTVRQGKAPEGNEWEKFWERYEIDHGAVLSPPWLIPAQPK